MSGDFLSARAGSSDIGAGRCHHIYVDGSGHGAGTAATLSCGACGTELPSNSKFCNECGARITQIGHAAEYKQVTVLFADVVHSMDIAAAVGAERLREIMARLVDRSIAVVQRYGGTVDKFTGDGIMAVFGAPNALEDHAVRACLAALGVQDEVKRLAAEVHEYDGVVLALRVGLNSGQVIAGEIGSAALGYTAIGEQVGVAQRMESVAPSGGVMLSVSTARLVEGRTVLGDTELVRIKGSDKPVSARRLLGMADLQSAAGRTETNLVGRRWEMSAAEGLVERAIEGHGAVVGVVGLPGIGKCRLVREVIAIAARRGADVFTTYCESHATQVPFHAVSRLLRAATGIDGLGGEAARLQVRAQTFDADPEDLVLFYELLGIGDPGIPPPAIDPDARRRRLTALVTSTSLARGTPAVYVIEDVHWIDEVSESMIAEFLAVIPQTHSLVLFTYRPEYEGVLAQVRGAQTIALAPLSDSETRALVDGLLGPDPSVRGLGCTVAERAAGNPFFVQEMIRELAERGVLEGKPAGYTSSAAAADVDVPASLQATIAARIDRLDPKAKAALCAASVLGSRFDTEMLVALGAAPVVDELVEAELVDQVTFTRHPEYAFHHPLIRTVAYESQLKADRAQLHRRVAAAIESLYETTVDEKAALIAEHLEAAGDLHSAYTWHMRAATWATNRDIGAAQLSWERAQRIADSLPADDIDRLSMRIAPRTMLCGLAWRVLMDVAGERFDELRQLCTAAGDQASLAIGMGGLVMELVFQGRELEASRVATDAWQLAETVGDPSVLVGLSFGAIYAKMEVGDWLTVIRWSQQVIDLAAGDSSTVDSIFGAPLAAAYATRALAGCCLGRAGWRDDQLHALAIARNADPMSYATVCGWVYNPGIPMGILQADEHSIGEIEGAVRIAERSGDDLAVTMAELTLGDALIHRSSADDRARGEKLLTKVSQVYLPRGQILGELPIVNVFLAREMARRGDRDDAIPMMRTALDEMIDAGQLYSWGIPASSILVETLLDRGTDADCAEAEAVIERLASSRADEKLAMRDVWLYRQRAFLARARGDTPAYKAFRDRYAEMGRSLGFEGHVDWAEAMP